MLPSVRLGLLLGSSAIAVVAASFAIAQAPPENALLRDNLDENGSGNRSLKRRPGSGGMIRSIIEVRKPFLLPLFDCR
jgi:predicted hotdog family 3-hydroxylacyl-ACP dehydratase